MKYNPHIRNILYYQIHFTMQVLFTYLSFSRSFSMPCASFSMLDGPGETGYNEVRVPVHGGWDSRDVSVFDCFKECLGFVMYLIIQYVGWGLFIMFVCLILFGGIYFNLIYCIDRFTSLCKNFFTYLSFYQKLFDVMCTIVNA